MNNVDNDNKCIKKLAVAMTVNPGATIKEIAEAAGISKATLYRLYGTRENLESSLIEAANIALNAFVEIAEGDYHVDFKEGIRLFIANHSDCDELFNYMFVLHGNLEDEFWKRYYKAIDTFFLKGQKRGVFRIDLPIQFLSEIFVAVACGISDAQRRGRVAVSGADELFEEFLLNGILA